MRTIKRKRLMFISCCFAELEENGQRIALTLVDTPGFGDNIDNEHAYVSYSL